MCPDFYQSLTNRNFGLLTEDQQNKLKNTTVAVCGLGGLGGVIAEILARSGIESLKILDHDTFDISNLNRQIFCFTDTIGQYKTEVTESFLKKINPDIRIEKLRKLTEDNVNSFLQGADVVALALDSLTPILILSRAAYRLKIPLVEGWAVAFGNARVFTEQTPTLEEAYGLPTIGREIGSISENEARQLMMHQILSLQKIPGLAQFYPAAAQERLVEKGEGTTFAPMVWLTCVMMSLEIIKVLLGWGKPALAPQFAVYDPFALQMVISNRFLRGS